MSEPKIEFQLKTTDTQGLERLQTIFDACFGRKVDQNYFRWKYVENPAGPVAACEAYDGDKVAGFYGILPEIYLVDGKETKVYQSMDTMTHPDYQRMGLFSRLAKTTFEHVVKCEGSLRMLGIPGIRALPGFVKLGWIHAHSFAFLFQHASLLRMRGNREGDVAVLDAKFAGWKQYFDSRQPLHGLRQKKYDATFFDWRVFRHPYRRYEVLGYSQSGALEGLLVSHEMEPNRRLVFLLDAVSPEKRRAAAAALIPALARRHPRDWIYAWEPTEHDLRSAYQRLWFLRNPFGRGPFCHRVPLILHQLGAAAERGDWIRPQAFDWQALNQD